MSREPAFDPRIEGLLALERDDPAPPESLSRVWSRVAASIAPAGGLFSPPPLPPPPRTLSGAIRERPLTAVCAAFVVGSLIGGGAALWVARRSIAPAETHAVVALPTTLPVAPPPQAGEVKAVAPPPASSGPVASPVSPAVSSPSGRVRGAPVASSLSEERALLDSARTALGAGDGARALAITETHRHRFARPQLGEEREAIAIQALVVAGRFDEARARAVRFQETAPDSLFAPAVEASLASIPR